MSATINNVLATIDDFYTRRCLPSYVSNPPGDAIRCALMRLSVHVSVVLTCREAEGASMRGPNLDVRLGARHRRV